MYIHHGNVARSVLAQAKKKYRNRLRKCRLRAMIATQEELAKLTGIDRTTISAIENNRLFLSSPYGLILKEVLGCSLDDLFEPLDTE
jgi:DNA-binding XRE family transcriptional regulator